MRNYPNRLFAINFGNRLDLSLVYLLVILGISTAQPHHKELQSVKLYILPTTRALNSDFISTLGVSVWPNSSVQNHDKYSNQWVRWSFFDCICQIILTPLFLITKHTRFPLDHPVNRNNPLLRISRWQYNMSFPRLHDSNKL